uniref:Polycystin cation channel PKD1/PKD2 domain-containing protein n=1 Tax=Esox lucius TaxID=8010 RepID=A0A3P8ZAC5_ESOLU
MLCKWENLQNQQCSKYLFSPLNSLIRMHLLLSSDFRRKLKYFFMNPCEKYRARGRKPWKLMLQILKIAIITFQLVSFGLSNQMMVTFKDENLMVFKHLFLKEYQDQRVDRYAVYTKTDVYDHIYYIIRRNLTVGNHGYETMQGGYIPLILCQEFYRNSNISPGNDTFNIDPHVDKECISIYPLEPLDDNSLSKDVNLSLDFKRLLSVNIYLTLKAINLQTVRHHVFPDCYDFTITIEFDNRACSGRIKINLENDVGINECKDWNVAGTFMKNNQLLLIDSMVIIACFMSLILCIRSVCSGTQLQLHYTAFFHTYYGKTVSWSERWEFVNGWYILIIVSDTLTIAGSALKIGIQTKDLTNYDVCSILLGASTILVWVGVIRYLGFFQKYNILILTLRAAFPNVIRFSCCAGLIYLGYCFCGWIVLGPYHEKFRTLDKVTECLFSLIIGDDSYSTFKKMREKNYMVWLFSRLYLYSFISLFSYMLLSLFIAFITDTYETIKVSFALQLKVWLKNSHSQVFH